MRRYRRFLCAAVAAMLVGGCTSVDETPDPNARPAALAPPTPTEPAPDKTTDVTEPPFTARPEPTCLVAGVITEPVSYEYLTRGAKVIVAATFDGYGAAFWDTPGGMRPTLADFDAADAVIVRPLHLTPFSTIRGAGVSIAAAQVFGGTIGCDQVMTDAELDIAQGSRYVFFLLPVMDSSGVFGDRLQASDAFLLSDDDRVLTTHHVFLPSEDPMTLSSLATFAASHPYGGSH